MKSRSSRAGKHEGIAGRGRHSVDDRQATAGEKQARQGELETCLLGLGRYFVIFSGKRRGDSRFCLSLSERAHIPAPT